MFSYFIVSKAAKGQQRNLLGHTAKRDTARADAKSLGGTVLTKAEFEEAASAGLITAASLNKFKIQAGQPVEATPAPAAKSVTKAPTLSAAGAANGLLGLAQQIAATTKVRKTIGKKDRSPKRVATSEAVIREAVAYAKQGVKAEANKVTMVRALAAWSSSDGFKLQRRDMFVVLREAGAELADATISTQFQLVRSGKLAEKAKA